MTLTITAEQVDRMARDHFNERLVTALRTAYPVQSQGVAGSEFATLFNRLRPKAKGYGLESEYQMAAFLHVAWLLGEEFDLRIPVLKQILCAANVPPQTKAEALGQFAVSVFALLDNDGGVKA